MVIHVRIKVILGTFISTVNLSKISWSDLRLLYDINIPEDLNWRGFSIFIKQPYCKLVITFSNANTVNFIT